MSSRECMSGTRFAARALVFTSAALYLVLLNRLNAQTQSRTDIAVESLVKAAEAAIRAGEDQKAVEFSRMALQQQPRWSAGWKNLGILLADRGEYSQAQEAFENLVKLEPKRGDGWVLLGLCKFRMGEYNRAVTDLEKARAFPIADKTLEHLLYYHSASVMILRGDFDTALKRLLILARQVPESDQLAEAYGLAAMRVAVLPGEEPSGMRAAVMEVGRLVARSYRQPVARTKTEFREVIAKYSATPGVQYAYGNFLAAHTYFREACDAFRAELRNSPHDAMSRLQIATIESQQFGNHAAALSLAEEAVRLAPQASVSHFVRGRILLKMGRAREAVEELETAARLAPDSLMVQHMLLAAYNKSHRKDDAARQQAVLKKLQQFEAEWKGRGSDTEPLAGFPAPPPGP